jgi:SM-20-related protein
MQCSQIDIPNHNATALTQALDSLAERHYAVIPNFLLVNMQQALLEELLHKQNDGFFHAANIGRGQHQARHSQIRGDSICWLETDFAIGNLYLTMMEQLRQQLNQLFYLGLRSFEGHYAHYQTGSVYQRHVDRHQDNNARVVSAVCYLNQDWPIDAGGELKLYNTHHELLLSLPPIGGTLVLFMSADMPHEVLAAQRSRYSIAGWFRQD